MWLLLHIDPVKMPLPIHKDTIKPLLEAARKYQLPTILHWFEREVTRAEVPLVDSNEDGEDKEDKEDEKKILMEEDPLLVLSLAVEHEMKELVPKAILATVNGGPLEESSVTEDVKHYRLIHCLRQKRIEKYLELINVLAELDEPSEGGSEVSEYDYDNDWTIHRITIKTSRCDCGTTRSSWLISVTEAILHNPRWESFIEAIEFHDNCDHKWSAQFKSETNYRSTKAKMYRRSTSYLNYHSPFDSLLYLLNFCFSFYTLLLVAIH
jgi:hypothetical protein